MSRKGRHESALSGTRRGFSLVLLPILLATSALFGAEADLLRTDTPQKAVDLQDKGARQADAIAYFITGLFAEESAGPEKALESKIKVLDLDPTCSDLAIEVASEYLRRGDTAEAVSVLKDTIAAAPKVEAPYLALSMVYLRHLQKPEFAIKYAQKALEVAPKTFGGYEMLWEIYKAQKQPSKAAQVLQKAAASKSDDPEFWLSLAEVSLRDQTRDDAPVPAELQAKVDQYLTQAVLHAPYKVNIISRAGDLYVLSKQIPKAIPLYQQVLESKPTSPHIREKLAGCYIETDQVDPAIVQVEELIKTNPLNLSAYQQLSGLYLKKGDLPKALASAKQALIIEPSNIDRHSLVIELLYRLKRYGDMADALSEARKQFPLAPNLTHLYAVALSQAKRNDEAMKAFAEAESEAVAMQPAMLNGDFYFEYGAAAEQAGQVEKAEELLKRSMDLDPGSAPRACNYLGYMWADRGERLEEADALIHRALAAEPDNGAYLDSLGWLLFKQGKYQEALAQLLRAAELIQDEPDATVYQHVGDAYQKLGKMAEAVLYWQKSLQLDPDNKDVVARLDQASEKVVQSPDKSDTPPK